MLARCILIFCYLLIYPNIPKCCTHYPEQEKIWLKFRDDLSKVSVPQTVIVFRKQSLTYKKAYPAACVLKTYYFTFGVVVETSCK